MYGKTGQMPCSEIYTNPDTEPFRGHDGKNTDEHTKQRIEEWWARPDLNWSYLHPKQEGYQATPRALAERGCPFYIKRFV